MNFVSFGKKVLLGGCFCAFSTLLSDSIADVKQHFDDVLLVVNYNHPHYQSIDFLKKMYGIAFSHIVFYGEKDDSRVYTINHHEGHYGYRALADAMRRHPHFRGYLYTNDDCFLNFWQLIRCAKNKLWVIPPYANLALNDQARPRRLEGDGRGWTWWYRECGYKAAKNVYTQLSEKNKRLLLHNCGASSLCYGFSDLVYIPREYAQEVQELCAVCSTQGLFLEIALPMICASVAPKEERENFNALISWYKPQEEVLGRYTLKYHAIHPLKFSDEKVRTFIEQRVEQLVAALR
ncbi:hypothetical protein CVU75_00970 [Candidatus Dependentiae bacterium HGW-Dependentiae-1]|nr:MAG: hypothetical protein CVU75_00970 [Candidatus Dependentiae bacterium HGW-Dependentiae-1]